MKKMEILGSIIVSRLALGYVILIRAHRKHYLISSTWLIA